MENNEKNPVGEQEKNPVEVENELLEQAAGGSINIDALLKIASDGFDQACGFDSCKHEPGVLLETRYHHNAVGHGHVPYERTRTYRCRKCGKEFTKKDHVSTPTL